MLLSILSDLSGFVMIGVIKTLFGKFACQKSNILNIDIGNFKEISLLTQFLNLNIGKYHVSGFCFYQR